VTRMRGEMEKAEEKPTIVVVVVVALYAEFVRDCDYGH